MTSACASKSRESASLRGLHSNDEDGATARGYMKRRDRSCPSRIGPLEGPATESPDLAGDRYFERGMDKAMVADWKQRLEACTSGGSG